MDKFSFDYWMRLYQDDPAEYERKRAEHLEQTILNAPVAYRNSMRMVQLQCDTIRQMYPPEEATIKMMELLSEKLKDLRAKLTEFREIVEDSNEKDDPYLG